MNNAVENQTIALASLMQSLSLVDELANKGNCDQDQYKYALEPLFLDPADNAAPSFGGVETVHAGLRLLGDINHSSANPSARSAMNYAVAVLHLERSLSKQDGMLGVISSRLTHVGFNQKHFEADPKAIAAAIAAIYQDTLSTLSFRIQVQGNPLHLGDKYTADRIRALLLASVRATRLWRQFGGRRLNLLLGRRRIMRCADQLLSQP